MANTLNTRPYLDAFLALGKVKNTNNDFGMANALAYVSLSAHLEISIINHLGINQIQLHLDKMTLAMMKELHELKFNEKAGK